MYHHHHFHFCTSFLIALLLFTSPSITIQAVLPPPVDSSAPSERSSQQAFQPLPAGAPAASRDFEPEKRKIPTGSNPLHNKR
nr:Clavata3/esr-related 20, putative [Ipomoea batatas]GMC70604.1 Clavata3/esr-related 20, putative [Ipomoea batatas]GME14436.1 Clavata3/esr-related 20, putative [Ipomoea batatas]